MNADKTRMLQRKAAPAANFAADKPVICIGRHTIDQLIAGQTVEIEAAIMIPASDLTNAA